MKLMFANNWKENIANVSEFCTPTKRTRRKNGALASPEVTKPTRIQHELQIINLRRKPAFSRRL